MTQNEWIMSDDTGTSSKTIWAVMMGVVNTPQHCNFTYNTPSDPSDYGRCYRLLELFPEWRNNLKIVGEIFPKWKPLINRWDELKSLWLKESPSGQCPELYQLMQTINEECMIADGYVKTSPSSWERKQNDIHFYKNSRELYDLVV